MELLNQYGQENTGMPYVDIPQPFSLANQSKSDLDKIRDEILDKDRIHSRAMQNFYKVHAEGSDNWRMNPRTSSQRTKRGLSNSRLGEFNRAVNTTANLWFTMLTAADPNFMAVAQGLNANGMELTEEDLYGAESVLIAQKNRSHFEPKLLKALRSLSAFGTVIIEEPWVSLPYGDGQKSFEYTDFVFRSLTQTGFDPYVLDLESSDYIFTVDFPTSYRLRELSQGEDEVWDKEAIERAIKFNQDNSGAGKRSSEAWDRVRQRKQRAGYDDMDKTFNELFTYHGKLDTENPVLQSYWESQGRTDDIRFCDFTVGILNGEEIVRLHATPYGSWKHIFKVAHVNQFELEPIGYGVSQMGNNLQGGLDRTESRMDDILKFNLYSMWKVGRFAGLKSSQLNIKPWNIVELDDINQLEPIRMDVQAITQALGMQSVKKEDFRNIMNAQTNLQAGISTAKTASEAALQQGEAMRGNSVIARIIAQTLFRDHLETCHLNNTYLLDNAIHADISGDDKPKLREYDRHNLPRNIGFVVKTVTDQDFRPERLKNLLQTMQILTSVRNFAPEAQGSIKPLLLEILRDLGMNPRLMRKPQGVAEQIISAVTLAAKQGKLQGGGQGSGGVGNEVAGESAGAGQWDGNLANPEGPVPTAPDGNQGLNQGALL